MGAMPSFNCNKFVVLSLGESLPGRHLTLLEDCAGPLCLGHAQCLIVLANESEPGSDCDR
jgi:hypothetical protein